MGRGQGQAVPQGPVNQDQDRGEGREDSSSPLCRGNQGEHPGKEPQGGGGEDQGHLGIQDQGGGKSRYTTQDDVPAVKCGGRKRM